MHRDKSRRGRCPLALASARYARPGAHWDVNAMFRDMSRRGRGRRRFRVVRVGARAVPRSVPGRLAVESGDTTSRWTIKFRVDVAEGGVPKEIRRFFCDRMTLSDFPRVILFHFRKQLPIFADGRTRGSTAGHATTSAEGHPLLSSTRQEFDVSRAIRVMRADARTGTGATAVPSVARSIARRVRRVHHEGRPRTRGVADPQHVIRQKNWRAHQPRV